MLTRRTKPAAPAQELVEVPPSRSGQLGDLSDKFEALDRDIAALNVQIAEADRRLSTLPVASLSDLDAAMRTEGERQALIAVIRNAEHERARLAQQRQMITPEQIALRERRTLFLRVKAEAEAEIARLVPVEDQLVTTCDELRRIQEHLWSFHRTAALKVSEAVTALQLPVNTLHVARERLAYAEAELARLGNE